MTSHRILLAAALSLTAGAACAAPPAVQATDAWCRATPPGAPAGGCYLTLTAAADDHLTAVESPQARLGEIHTMSIQDGIMRMRRLPDGLALPAGKAVALKPGAEHLMLIGPTRPLAAGGEVALTLRFAKAPPLTIKAPIRSALQAAH